MSPHIFYGVVIVIDECVEWYLIIHTLSIQNPPLLYVIIHINYVLNIMKVKGTTALICNINAPGYFVLGYY